jgi:hypothetical protein
MLYVRPELSSEKHAEWVETDSDKLALEGTYIHVPTEPRDAHSSADSSAKHDHDNDHDEEMA